MFGWGKKKKAEEKVQNIQVIPDEFYATKDPVVHYGNKGTGGSQTSLPIKIREGLSGDGMWQKIKNKKVLLYIILGLVFLGAVGVITWYYLNQAGLLNDREATVETNKTNIIDEQVEVEAEIGNIIENSQPPTEQIVEEIVVSSTVTSTAGIEATEVLSEQKILVFPRIVLTDSADIDSDSLTDMEEEIYSTDSGNFDTDADGYYDGQEVQNLYNPAGSAPVKLIDSGLVREYVNPIWQYRVYYPAAWESGVVDADARQVLFNSITGDFIEVAVDSMQAGEDFSAWFGRQAKEQKFSDLTSFTNRFKESGYKRQDGLVAYFIRDKSVYILLYNPGVTGFISFRHIMEMMAQSFRPSSTVTEIPEQNILPLPPGISQANNSTSTAGF